MSQIRSGIIDSYLFKVTSKDIKAVKQITRKFQVNRIAIYETTRPTKMNCLIGERHIFKLYIPNIRLCNKSEYF